MELSVNTIWVAFSGGLDSTVLLHQLSCGVLPVPANAQLQAVHIHHGLNANADRWQEHCEKVCAVWGIPLRVHHLDLSDSSKNIEERARMGRYHYFASLLKTGDVMYTGHHEDDQAETVLLQLIRGAGPKGLSAMPCEAVLGAGKLVRPLLAFSRAQLLDYAKERALAWIEDDSNQNERFARNFIRHEVMPLLKTRWPSVAETLSRSAQHCAEAEDVLKSYADILLNSCMDSRSYALSLSQLKRLTMLEQKQVIRRWLTRQSFLLPSESQLYNLLETFLYAAQDKNPMMEWRGVQIRRYRDQLFAMQPLGEHDAKQVILWSDLSAPLLIKSLHISLKMCLKKGVGLAILPHQRCEIRFRHEEASLKKRFQSWGVPPWLRNRIPLLYVDNKLASVLRHGFPANHFNAHTSLNYYCADEFTVKKEEWGRELIVELVA